MKTKINLRGIIYPIPQEDYDTLKSRKNPIYIKFLSKNSTELKIGHILIFYLSRKNKTLIGYSKIINVYFKSPLDILKYHKDNTQMKEEKIIEYIHTRENKNILVLELDEIKDFDIPIKIDYPITMMGKYVHIEGYNYIFSKK